MKTLDKEIQISLEEVDGSKFPKSQTTGKNEFSFENTKQDYVDRQEYHFKIDENKTVQYTVFKHGDTFQMNAQLANPPQQKSTQNLSEMIREKVET